MARAHTHHDDVDDWLNRRVSDPNRFAAENAIASRSTPELGRRGGCNPRRSRSLEALTPSRKSIGPERGQPEGTGEVVGVEVSSVCREGNLRRPNLGGVTSTLGTTSGRAQSAPTRSPTSSREGPVTAAAAERGMSQRGGSNCLRTVVARRTNQELCLSRVALQRLPGGTATRRRRSPAAAAGRSAQGSKTCPRTVGP